MADEVDVITLVARLIDERRTDHPLRVAIDGITASGKTTFADRLAEAVRARGVEVIRVTMDGFHNPRAVRHRQGRMSADGYYEDAYDFESTARDLLRPLGPLGSGESREVRRYRPQVFDLATDRALVEGWRVAADDSVLIIDGSFLQRPELVGLWDEVVFLDVEFANAAERGVERDAEAFGGADQAREAFAHRYHAAGRRYLDEVAPSTLATVVIDNNDVVNPRVVRA